MATDNEAGGRRQTIAAAIAAELERQGSVGLDVNLLAEAIDHALDAHLPMTEGRRPEDLNATNDD